MAGGGNNVNSIDLTLNTPFVTEGDNGTVEMVFTLTLSEDASETLTLDYTSTDGSATVADNDYTAVNGTVTIPQGSRTADISIFVNGDEVFEADETFNLELSNPQGIQLSQSSFTVAGAITNDDDAEPKGYYTGSATVNSTTLTDMTGMMYDNRLMMFSPTANVLYDITITDITLRDVAGTVDVYVDGSIDHVGGVTISGTTDESNIQGTIAGGTGFADGSFDIEFDVGNNKTATLARIETFGSNKWKGDFHSVDVVIGDIGFNSTGVYGGTTNFPICEFSQGVTTIPSVPVSIYQLSNVVNAFTGCQNGGIDYTGFGVVLDGTGTDTTMFCHN